METREGRTPKMKKMLVLALAALFAVAGAASAGLLNSEEPGEVTVAG